MNDPFSGQDWQGKLAAFIKAADARANARRDFLRTNRTFCNLAERVGDDRAWSACGARVDFLNRRSLKAYKIYVRALDALIDAPFNVRLKAFGVAACMSGRLDHHANDDRRRRACRSD